MFQKLFGKKKSNFFLELKETGGEQPVAAKTTPSVPSVEAPAPAPEIVSVNLADNPTAANPVEADKKAKKTSVKKDKKAKKAEPKAIPISAPVATSSVNGKVEPKEVEFATKYLLGPSSSRRRPGPSLNPFKDMARKAKLPLNKG
jgi:hypothetical protein